MVFAVFSDVGMIDGFDRFFEEIYDLFRDSRGWMLFPETRQVLEVLHRNRFKLGIVSNFDSRLYSALKDLGIDTLLHSVTICSEVGFAKPDPQIFGAALRTLGVRAERTLFTGDSLVDDFQAAQNAGLVSFLLDRSSRYASMVSVPRITTLHDILPIAGIAPNS